MLAASFDKTGMNVPGKRKKIGQRFDREAIIRSVTRRRRIRDTKKKARGVLV